MSYFAAAVARRGRTWDAEELDLRDVEDLDGVIDAMRVATGDDADTVVLLLEEDDEWFAIVRVDEDSDPRVFVSDRRVMETSTLGAILGEAAEVETVDDDEDEDEGDDDEDDDDGRVLAGEPVGDAEVLSDLGTPASRLLKLSAEEGLLPGDVISALCESAGCLEPLETLRGG